LIGIALAFGGVRLVTLGGSFYYVVAAATLLVSATLIWRGNKKGAWLYGALFIGTVIWSLVEVGFDAWALASRLAMFAVLGLWLLVPRTRRALNDGQPVKPLLQLRATAAAVGPVVVLLIMGAWSSRTPAPPVVPHVADLTSSTD